MEAEKEEEREEGVARRVETGCLPAGLEGFLSPGSQRPTGCGEEAAGSALVSPPSLPLSPAPRPQPPPQTVSAARPAIAEPEEAAKRQRRAPPHPHDPHPHFPGPLGFFLL